MECCGTAAVAVSEKRKEFLDLEETARPWRMVSRVATCVGKHDASQPCWNNSGMALEI